MCNNSEERSSDLCFLQGNSLASEFYVHLHLKFRRRGITQKKPYNIQNTVKV